MYRQCLLRHIARTGVAGACWGGFGDFELFFGEAAPPEAALVPAPAPAPVLEGPVPGVAAVGDEAAGASWSSSTEVCFLALFAIAQAHSRSIGGLGT